MSHFQILVLLYALLIFSAETRKLQNNNDILSSNNDATGTKWAVLIAGSKGYGNYRHQADVCHAYQILRKAKIKDENIIVFMYDDIAYDPENPRPGVVINSPLGEDLYAGVLKDYTGDAVNSSNFYNVLLGNEKGISGGNGKVLKSGPNDNIFIYYVDHGAPGLLAMPNEVDLIYAHEFNKVLEKMHRLNRYNKMVIYVEACESGSMFQGILKNDLNIFAMTSANARESSWAAYCPGFDQAPPTPYKTCLGDKFSVAWLEDSDMNDMSKETLKHQYLIVKQRTGGPGPETSHVCHFGTEDLLNDFLDIYIGSNPKTRRHFSFSDNGSLPISSSSFVNPRDIPLVYLQRKIQDSPMESPQRQEAQKKLLELMNHRKQIDQKIVEILRLSLKQTDVVNLLTSTRTEEESLVDDWDCFKTLVNSFKSYCGATVDYGLKYTGALANLCNSGVNVKQIVSAIEQACSVK